MIKIDIKSDEDEVTIKMNIIDVDTFCSYLDNAAMSLDDEGSEVSHMVEFIQDLTRRLSTLTQNL